jgi:hypothetical protein
MSGPAPRPEGARFWEKVDRSGDCWTWTASDNGQGYGQFYLRSGRKVHAHRYAYEAVVGPIPAGLELDHLCANPSCVNPRHLEPVPHRTNMLRGRRNFIAAHAEGRDCGGVGCSNCRRFRSTDVETAAAS